MKWSEEGDLILDLGVVSIDAEAGTVVIPKTILVDAFRMYPEGVRIYTGEVMRAVGEQLPLATRALLDTPVKLASTLRDVASRSTNPDLGIENVFPPQLLAAMNQHLEEIPGTYLLWGANSS